MKEKHDIRTAFSPQLKELWSLSPQLADIKNDIDIIPIREVIRGKIKFPNKRNVKLDFYARVRFRDSIFIPLVTRGMELQCQIDIQFLRREEPGAIVQGGDLDNRLKTLLDGLRMPLKEQEVPEGVSNEGPIFCLAEDDSLFTSISIEAGRLLGPLQGKEKPEDVDITIRVYPKVVWPMLSNLHWSA